MRVTKHSQVYYVSVLFAFLLTVVLSPAVIAYSGGAGTEADPYLIADANDLVELHNDPNDWDKVFNLTADLNMNFNFITLHEYTIGYFYSETDNKPFTGIFDGKGYSIGNVYGDSNNNRYTGLFEYLQGPGAIRNLNLVEVTTNAGYGVGYKVGALVGYNDGGMITNCSITDSAIDGWYEVGAMVGFNDGGSITNCSVTETNVYGLQNVGGLAGYNTGIISYSSFEGNLEGCGRCGGIAGANSGDIFHCKSEAKINFNFRPYDGSAAPDRTSTSTGGLVGVNTGSIARSFSVCDVNVLENFTSTATGGLVGAAVVGSIEDCYATGQVIGDYAVGGLVGGNESELINCYSNCVVIGENTIGAVVGDGDYGTSTYSGLFWNKDLNPTLEGIGNVTDPGEVYAETLSNMKKQKTFHAVGWDFEDAWGIGEEQTYPYVKINQGGDVNHDGFVNLKDLAGVAADWLNGDDIDQDGIGDLVDKCDGHDDSIDSDNDHVPDGCDICPGYHDNGPDDDGDGIPNLCDLCEGYDDSLDQDADTVPDDCDNCLTVPNTGQEDADADTFGDACDICPGFDDLLDNDLDGVPDGCDVCAGYDDLQDQDADGVPDACDNCPSDPNPTQTDSDFDGPGDACDQCDGYPDFNDNDFDGVPDACDNCLNDYNPGQEDTDEDGIGDACDPS